jgi:hypothetical protein
VFASDSYAVNPSANFAVQFGQVGPAFFWKNAGITYTVPTAALHQPWSVRLRGREMNAEVDAIALVKVGSGASPDDPFTHTQVPGDSVLAFAAEAPDSISDLDADAQGFVRADGGVAQGWHVLQATSGASGSQESYARYRVRFADAGTYTLQLRGRGQSTSQDSVLAPTGFGASPLTPVYFPTGAFGWRSAVGLSGFVVVAADVGKVLDLVIGTRERNTELDSVAFVRNGADASEARLDAKFGSFEAENATLTGTAISTHTLASGGSRISDFGDVGDQIDFGNLAVQNRLYVRYSLGSTVAKQASVYVDDVDVATINFSYTGSWDSYDTTFVYLPHSGSVRLQIDADDYAMNLDASSAIIDRLTLSEGPIPCVLNEGDDISTKLGSAAAGETYIMPSKVYVGLPSLTLVANGLPDRPVTLRAQTAGQVILEGGTTVSIQAPYTIVDGLSFQGQLANGDIIHLSSLAQHSRVTNTTIVGGQEMGVGNWVRIYGKHNRLDHNHLVGKVTEGITVVAEHGDRQNHYNVIDSNYFGTRAPGPTDANGYETLRTGLSSDALHPAALTVKNNLFYRCDGEAEIISNKSAENYYFFNTFRESKGGLVLRQGGNVRVEGNVFLGTPGLPGTKFLGVRLHSEGHVVVNNHFQDTEDGITLGIGQAGLAEGGSSVRHCYWPVTDVILAHNTMVNLVKAGIWAQTMETCVGIPSTEAPSRVFVVNNFVKDSVFANDQEDNGGDIRHSGNVSGSTSPPTGWTTEAWTFAIDTKGLLRPTTAHPGLSASQWPAGYPANPVSVDVDGQLRGSQPDVGADQFTTNGTSNTRAPLEFEDVGPRWGIRSTVR